MAVTAGRKLAIAERAHALLTQKYGIPGRDLIFDPLVFPSHRRPELRGLGVETIEGVG